MRKYRADINDGLLTIHHSSVEALAEEADQPEHLVPVVIDFDVQSLNPDQQGIKLKDRFLWNINGMYENGNLGSMSTHCLIRTICHAETIRIDVLR